MSTPLDSRARGRLRRGGILVVLVAVVVVAYGLISRAAQSARVREATAAQALPSVAVATPQAVTNRNELVLPGRLQAYIRAPIYARVPGYLKSWRHDIGAQVKAGTVLAEIDTPDLDQQLAQARADLGVAEANAKLAEVTAKRWQALDGTDAVAKQDIDQRSFSWNASLAQLKSAQANVDRLVAQEGFKRLTAPFDGVVTARTTDIGALIDVGASGGVQLFEVSDVHRLRVYVGVPQSDVPKVPPGTKALIGVPEHPGRTYGGVVEAASQAVDPASGTTLMEIIVDNPRGELMTGDYASIHLQVPGAGALLSIPSSALIFNAKGLSVATLDADSRIRVKPVVIARDLGATVEIGSGLEAGDRVVQNPPDGVDTGVLVRAVGDVPAAVAPHA